MQILNPHEYKQKTLQIMFRNKYHTFFDRLPNEVKYVFTQKRLQ